MKLGARSTRPQGSYEHIPFAGITHVKVSININHKGCSPRNITKTVAFNCEGSKVVDNNNLVVLLAGIERDLRRELGLQSKMVEEEE